MGDGNLKTQIAGIEAQLRVLRASRGAARPSKQGEGLRALKGALRGEGKFSPEEIDAAKAQFRDDA
ncbi:MAG: hypothetical protein ACODAJ_05335 [Planctomycetota bacterium]